jgi:hypothetical protein
MIQSISSVGVSETPLDSLLTSLDVPNFLPDFSLEHSKVMDSHPDAVTSISHSDSRSIL